MRHTHLSMVTRPLPWSRTNTSTMQTLGYCAQEGRHGLILIGKPRPSLQGERAMECPGSGHHTHDLRCPGAAVSWRRNTVREGNQEKAAGMGSQHPLPAASAL